MIHLFFNVHVNFHSNEFAKHDGEADNGEDLGRNGSTGGRELQGRVLLIEREHTQQHQQPDLCSDMDSMAKYDHLLLPYSNKVDLVKLQRK